MLGGDTPAVPAVPCRDHTVADGLDYVATWNSAMLPQVGRWAQ